MLIFVVRIVFIPLQQKTKFSHIKNYVEIKDFCNIVMPSEDTKIIDFNQY